MLSEIESNAGHKTNYLDTTLEHIFPYNPEQEWYRYFGEGAHDITDRLGNMILLDNDELGRADFATKKLHYLKTPFKLANQIAKYEHWDLANLNNYQSWLADQAAKTWQVD